MTVISKSKLIIKLQVVMIRWHNIMRAMPLIAKELNVDPWVCEWDEMSLQVGSQRLTDGGLSSWYLMQVATEKIAKGKEKQFCKCYQMTDFWDDILHVPK